MFRPVLGSIAMVAAFGAANPAQAVLVSGDFIRTVSGVTTSPVSGDTAATGPVDNATGMSFTGQIGPWNGLNVGPQGNQSRVSFSSGFLNNGNGNPTTVQFHILPTNLPSPQQFAYRAGASTVNTPAPDLRHEFAGIHTGLSVPPFMNWLVTGLDPSAMFDMVIFGGAAEGAANDNANATMVTNGIAGVKDAEGDWNWSGLSNAAGELQIRIEIPVGGVAQSRYFGFQIQSAASAAVPEPATLGLAGLGLTMLAARRRRMA